MNPLDFWRYKILQILHDPPGKPYARYYRPPKKQDATTAQGKSKAKGGHAAFSHRLVEALGVSLDMHPSISLRPDHAATGADRPVVGHGGQTRVIWGRKDQNPLATHPLAKAPLALDGAKGESRTLMPKESFETQLSIVEGLSFDAKEWHDAKALKEIFFQLWRRFREDILELNVSAEEACWKEKPKMSLLWQHMPADTRCPDHSIWDHNRMTSALAFIEGEKKSPLLPAREPWLLSFAIGPVQAFIAEARKSRDLWTNSMLLADLSWHAMLPVVKQYGPDTILYPDLNGNPMVDRWLLDHPEEFPDLFRQGSDFRTWAALLPHHWVAVLPRGGSEHLVAFETLTAVCCKAVQDRWQELSRQVRDHLVKISQNLGLDPAMWLDRWNRQHENVIHTLWTAVPWIHAPETPRSPGGALPAQRRPADPATAQTAVNPIPSSRKDRLEPWMTDKIWGHYEATREVYHKTLPGYLTGERGFDYALVHHQLSLWHTVRKQARTYPKAGEDAAERCTICSHRAALEPDKNSRGIDSQRAAVKRFWQKLGGHEEIRERAWGEEHLCAICAFRRLLVPFGVPKHTDDFNRVWTGSNPAESLDSKTGVLRQPFPSTAAVASQRFLRAVTLEDRLEHARRAVAAACRKAKWAPTFFHRSLSSLAELPEEDFLTYDPQVFFESARMAELRRAGKEESVEARDLGRAIAALMKFLKQINESTTAPADKIPLPRSRFALVALDGDGLGRLLLGDPEQVKVPWKDVLHPAVVKQLKINPSTSDAGWAYLLSHPRLMGPSLQAFLSRALGHFSHRIVPWVVEREFHGRLIYAGGDDLLAMVDADGLGHRLVHTG